MQGGRVVEVRGTVVSCGVEVVEGDEVAGGVVEAGNVEGDPGAVTLGSVGSVVPAEPNVVSVRGPLG